MGQELSVVRIPKNYRSYKKTCIVCRYCKNELTWNDKYYRFEVNDIPSKKLRDVYEFLIDVPFCTFNCACKFLITKRKDKEIVSEIPSEIYLEYGDSVTHYRFSQTFRTALRTYDVNAINDNFDLYLIGKERTETFGDGQIVMVIVGYTEKKTKRSTWLASDGVICASCKTKLPLNKAIFWSYSKKTPFCNLQCAYKYVSSSALLKNYCIGDLDDTNGNGNRIIEKTLALYYGSIKSMIVNDNLFKTMLMDLDYVFCISKLCKDAVKLASSKQYQQVNNVEFQITKIGYQYH